MSISIFHSKSIVNFCFHAALFVAFSKSSNVLIWDIEVDHTVDWRWKIDSESCKKFYLLVTNQSNVRYVSKVEIIKNCSSSCHCFIPLPVQNSPYTYYRHIVLKLFNQSNQLIEEKIINTSYNGSAYVRLKPVTNLTVLSKTSLNVTVSWLPPHYLRRPHSSMFLPAVYRLQLLDGKDKLLSVKEISYIWYHSTSNFKDPHSWPQITFEPLISYTVYSILIQCRPPQSKLYSQIENITFRTEPGVPSETPGIVQGYIKSPENQLAVYVGGIHRNAWNGPIGKVVCDWTPATQPFSWTIMQAKHFVCIFDNVSQVVNYFVYAQGVNGLNSRPSPIQTVGLNNDFLLSPQVKREKHSYIFLWQNDCWRVSVLYCNGTYECESPPQMKILTVLDKRKVMWNESNFPLLIRIAPVSYNNIVGIYSDWNRLFITKKIMMSDYKTVLIGVPSFLMLVVCTIFLRFTWKDCKKAKKHDYQIAAHNKQIPSEASIAEAGNEGDYQLIADSGITTDAGTCMEQPVNSYPLLYRPPKQGQNGRQKIGWEIQHKHQLGNST